VNDGPLLALLHLCDSLFPTGSYAHSDGLEAAVAEGRVSTGADLEHWLTVCLHECIGRCDGPVVMQAVAAAADGRRGDVRRLDEEVHALRPSAAARRSTRHLGRRLLRTWQASRPDGTPWPSLALDDLPRGTLPVAFGVVCASIGTPPRAAVHAFAYTRLAAAVSCAMRLLPIGQHEAHARLAATLARVPRAVTDMERRTGRASRPSAFVPLLDLAAMSHQYVHSRLFLS